MKYTLDKLENFKYQFDSTSKKKVKISNTLQSINVVGPTENSITEQLVNFDSGEHLSAIEDYSFVGCKTLTAVTLQNSTTYIGDNAFKNCENLSKINLESPEFTYIGNNAFENTGLENIDLNYVKTRSDGDSGYVFEQSETFKGNQRLTNVNLQTNNIDNYMFSECKNLKTASITINGNADYVNVGQYVFNGCQALKTVQLSGNINVNNWFNGCTNIEKIEILDASQTLFGDSIFKDCKKLTELTVSFDLMLNCDQNFLAGSNVQNIALMSPLSALDKFMTQPAKYPKKISGSRHGKISWLDLYDTIKNDEREDFRYGEHYNCPAEAWEFCKEKHIPLIVNECRVGCGNCEKLYLENSLYATQLYRDYTLTKPYVYVHEFGNVEYGGKLRASCGHINSKGASGHIKSGESYYYWQEGNTKEKHIPFFCCYGLKLVFNPASNVKDFVVVEVEKPSLNDPYFSLPLQHVLWQKDKDTLSGAYIICDEEIFSNNRIVFDDSIINISPVFKTYVLDPADETGKTLLPNLTKSICQLRENYNSKTLENVGCEKTYAVIKEYFKKKPFGFGLRKTDIENANAYGLYEKQLNYILGSYKRDSQYNSPNYDPSKPDPLENILADDSQFTFFGIGHDCEITTSDGYRCKWSEADKKIIKLKN